MIKQEIKVEVLVADNNVIITSDEGEANTKFQEKLLDMCQKCALQVSFFCFLSDSNEVKNIGVFERVLRQIGVQWGKGRLKIGEGLPFSLKHVCLDLNF